MSKVGCLFLLVVMMTTSPHANAFWFNIPSDDQTLSIHGQVEETQQALNPQRINLLVWNIYKGGLLGWRIDLQHFTQNRDLVLLQEGILNDDMRAEFDAARKLEYVFATSFVYKTTGHATGVVSAARVAPSESIFLRSHGRELVGFSPKMILITKYPIQGSDQELMALNIHALNTVSWKKMAAQVLMALRQVKDHQGPVIFAGDFNSWSKKKEQFILRAMKRAGLHNVELANGEERLHVFGRPLDYIFVRGLKAKNARVIAEATGSDHKPLSVMLRVSND